MARADRLFLPLDVQWYEDWGHEVSNDACVLWLQIATVCKQLASDGKIKLSQIRRAAPMSLQKSDVLFSNALTELVEHEDAPLVFDGTFYVIPKWEKWNDTSAEIAAKSEGGEYGNHIKWHVQKKQKPKSPCVFCESSVSDIATESLSESNSIVEYSRVEYIKPLATATQSRKKSKAKGATDETPKPKQPRPRDIIFETVAGVCGIDWKNITPTERGRLNAAVKELKTVNATVDDIRERAKQYRKIFPNVSFTPNALSANWSILSPVKKSEDGYVAVGAAPMFANEDERKKFYGEPVVIEL